MKEVCLILLCTLIFCNCERTSGVNVYEFPELPSDNEYQVTIKSGVWGNVWFWKGNFQPADYGGVVFPVEREVYFYELTHQNAVELVEEYRPFYKKINSKLIKMVKSNRTGFFQTKLPEGKYSIFIKEKDFFYANLSDGKGFIFPVEVKEDSLSKVQFDIRYKARG